MTCIIPSTVGRDTPIEHTAFGSCHSHDMTNALGHITDEELETEAWERLRFLLKSRRAR
jgi:hypothetical protein